MIGNEERRQLLIAQHDRLRVLIWVVRSTAGVVLATNERQADRGGQSLRDALRELELQLDGHLATEEAILAPTVSRLDARRSIRLDLMRAEHARQRAMLSALRAEDKRPYTLASRAASLAEALLADITAEERDFVSLLRDDGTYPNQSDA